MNRKTKIKHALLNKRLHATAIILVSLFLITLSLSSSLDERGLLSAKESFKEASIVFASAKAFNGIISVIQSTQVGPPGVTIAIGEILDPLNDLIEQFSWIMLASLVSLGIQITLIKTASSEIFNIFFISMIIVSNLLYFTLLQSRSRSRSLLIKSVLIIIFLRFCVPVVALCNEAIYTNFIQPQYNIQLLNKELSTQKNLLNEEHFNTIGENRKSDEVRDRSWMKRISDSTKNMYEKTANYFSSDYYKDLTLNYQSKAESSSQTIVNLIVVFVIQTLLLPLLFLFMIYKIVQSISRFHFE